MEPLSAVQGKLVTATRQVEEEVAQKFGALKAEKDALIENLDLLSRSGALSREETRRAEAQKARQQEERRRIDAQADEQEEIWKIAVSVAQAASRLPNGSQIIDRIQNATTKEEALRIATESGLFAEPAEVGVPEPEKHLTINQIEQFRRSYGWTPPFGFTENQLLQYMADNPDATPEELEAGAKQILGDEPETPQITETPDTVISFINENITDSQLKVLKRKADEAGISSVLKTKKVDVKNYL